MEEGLHSLTMTSTGQKSKNGSPSRLALEISSCYQGVQLLTKVKRLFLVYQYASFFQGASFIHFVMFFCY